MLITVNFDKFDSYRLVYLVNGSVISMSDFVRFRFEDDIIFRLNIGNGTFGVSGWCEGNGMIIVGDNSELFQRGHLMNWCTKNNLLVYIDVFFYMHSISIDIFSDLFR